jgi:hypothetical protein
MVFRADMRENVFIKGGKNQGLIFVAKTAYIGVKSCEKSTARISEE